MIRLFRRDETNFDHNEWVLNRASKCLVTEVTNGTFELDFEYPIQDEKGLAQYLVTGNIIKCDVGDNRGEQLFRIRKISGDKTKTVFAQSKLIADLSANRVQAFTIAGKTRKQAIQMVFNNALETHSYVVGTKDTNTNTNFIVDIQEGSVLDALVGSKNSILSVYGGEFIIDNNTIDIVNARGTDRGFDIRYGKNIKGIKATEDDTDLATVIVPKVDDLRLPEYVVESSNVSAYEKRYFKELDISGLKVWDGTGTQGTDEISQAQAYVKMREASNLLFTSDHVDLINFTYELDLAILSKTEEYKSKSYYLMETVYLSDTVYVRHEILNIDLFGKVSKTIYNSLLGKYDSVTVGFQKQNLTDIINNTIRTIKFTEQSILLRVSNVEGNLYSQIEMTATQIRSEVADTKAGLESSITQTATQIRSEVSNADAGLQSSITQNANSITSVVTRVGAAESNITQQANQIALRVKEGDLSTLIEQNDKSVAIAIKNQTEMNVVFDSAGETIKNGALVIEDSNGSNMMTFDDGVVNCSVVGTKELIIHNTDKGSSFYETLANMDEIYCDKFACNRIFIGDKHIYDYIVGVLQDKGLI